MQQESSLKGKVLSGLVWRLAERAGVQGVTFIVSVVLARLIPPAGHGTLAILLVFITLANILLEEGFGAALVQKLDADNLDFSSVFYFNLVFSVALYLLLFSVAPLIANFYSEPLLAPTLRVLGLNIPLSAVNAVQQAYVTRHMLFKRFFFSTLGGTLLSGALGIGMAYAGYGVWALVAQYLSNTVMVTLVLWFTVRWRPQLMFSFTRLKQLLSFGWKMLLSSLLNKGYNDIIDLFVGKRFNNAQLGIYNRGRQLPNQGSMVIYNSVSSVLFPALAKKQQDKNAVLDIVSLSIRCSSYLIIPLMLGLGLVAEPLVYVLYGEQWMPSVPYLQIFCINYAFMPIHVSSLAAIKALGRSDLYLKLEIIKKLVGVTLLVVAFQFGMIQVALATALSSLISAFINSWPNKKLFGYSYGNQLRDLLPILLLAAGMGAVVWLVGQAPLAPLPLLIAQVLAGVASYLGLSLIFRVSVFRYLWRTVLEFLRSLRGKKAPDKTT